MEDCPNCEGKLFRASKDARKVKARTSMLILHKSGEVEINCPHCKQGVLLPLVAAGPPVLRKARVQRFVVMKKKTPQT